MLKGHMEITYILAIVADCIVGNGERFVSRMATTVLGTWHQMLSCDRNSSAVLEVWLAIVPVF